MALGALRTHAPAAGQTLTGGFRASAPLARLGVGLVALGLVACVFAPGRLAGALLLAGLMAVQVGMGSLFFVALHHAAAARWGVVLRRVAEALGATVPWSALGLLVVLTAAGPSLYPWVHHAQEGFRAFWYRWGFFVLRAAVILAAWALLSRWLVSGSLAQARGDGVSLSLALRRRAVAFLPVFAVSFSVSAFDWLMSQEPEWVSTIFAVYVFAGAFTAGLAAITLVVTVLLHRGPRRLGPLSSFVNEHHLHDLGKLLFAFATFWAYIWFSQYMLIWYANLPEEAAYFVKRLGGLWQPLFIANLFANWVIPFVALLPRSTKQNPQALRNVALCLLAGHALDLYLMVGPSQGWRPLPTLLELGLVVGALLLVLAGTFGFLEKHPVVPVGDPFLEESRHHHG